MNPDIIKNTGGIKHKTINGILWSGIDSFASSGITFIVGIVLARLLSPSQFGTIGLATVFIAIMNSIVDCGFSSAIIRKQNIKDVDYNTAFYTNLVISIFLFICTFLLAPYIGLFFNNPELSSVIRALCSILVINAFALVQRSKLTKEVNFKIQTIISISASIVSGCIGIILAASGYGVWSLVGQQISRQTINTFLLWIFNKWRPQLQFSITSFKELFNFGSKLLVSGIIDNICNELATIVIGKVNSPATLGQYSRAKSFSSIFSSNLTSVIQRVTYPVLSKLQDNEEQLVTYYRKICRVLMYISCVFMFTLAASAKEVILALIGPHWHDAILYLQLICFIDLLFPMRAININILNVKGYSNYVLKLSIIKRCIEVIPICLGFINIKYLLYGFIITGVIGYLLNAYYASKVIEYSIKEQISDMIPSIGYSIAIGCAVLLVNILDLNIYVSLILKISIGLVGCASFCYIGKSQTCIDVKNIFLATLAQFRHK